MREGRILDVLMHTKVLQHRMHGPDDVVPAYSTDIAIAMSIVEALRKRGYAFVLLTDAKGPARGLYEAEFDPSGAVGHTQHIIGVSGSTAPLAICLAAKKVVEQA